MSRVYKCRYSKCLHVNEPLTPENEIVEKGLHYHKDCLATKQALIELIDYYSKKIDRTVVYAVLNKVISTIVFTKKVSAEYLLFAIKYAHSHNLTINNPCSLYYLITKREIKNAYIKHCQSDSLPAQTTSVLDEETDFDFNKCNYVATKDLSFSDILKGGGTTGN